MVNLFRNASHALAAVTTNCAGFRAAWENVTRPAGWEGRWEGEWRSEANGHHGALRCVLSKKSPQEIKAFFHGRYGKIFRVCYSVSLQARGAGDTFELSGQADLGELAGGIYEYDGTLGPGRFHCRYRCRYDHGDFEMKPAA